MREWDGNRLVQKYTVSCYCNKETVQLRESVTAVTPNISDLKV